MQAQGAVQLGCVLARQRAGQLLGMLGSDAVVLVLGP